MPAMKMKSITIEVSLVPRTVDVSVVSLDDNQEYFYSGATRRASKRLQDILAKLAAAYAGDDDSLELNVSTDSQLIVPDS
jgi:hypothetical protein